MKNKTRFVALSVVFCTLFTLLLQIFSPIISFADDETVHIDSASDLVELSKNCSYDAWSEGKNVVLTKDISLEGINFEPIASFCGTFDGQGHTISGLNITGAFSPAGLFAILESEAIVKNLNVSGVISPDGDKGVVGGIAGINKGKIEGCSFNGTVIGSVDIGGIAGINRINGTISSCSVSGEIIGETRTGGIAGNNEGMVSSSENSSKVNTICINPSVSLDDINISLTLDISKISSLNNSSMTDTGGIAGYSTGIIMGCINNGTVGYPHIGYNVGGIAGRTSGHLNSNINNAVINGRKDVGGIAGQIEPFISYDLSEDLLLALKTELDLLKAAVGDALDSTGGSIPTVSTRLNTILENLDLATNSLNTLINDASGYGDDFINEVNRLGEILDQVISQISVITTDLPELARQLRAGLINLEDALEGIREFSAVSGGAVSDIISAADDASGAFGKIGDSVNNLKLGLDAFKNALTVNDKDAAKAALTLIADELGNFIGGTDDFTNALDGVIDVLGNNAWMNDVITQIESLVNIFGGISESVANIYEATTEIKDNIDLHWAKFEEAGDEFTEYIGHLADMTSQLNEAVGLMDSGFNKISEGLDSLKNSVTVNDPSLLNSSVEQIEEGFALLGEATDKASSAIAEIGVLLENADIGNIDGLLDGLSESVGDLAESMGDLGDAMTSISGGVTSILQNAEIDFDAIENGGALIIGGIGDISSSLDKLKDVTNSLSLSMEALDGAVSALNEAVVIQDEAKVSEALNEIYSILGNIIDSANALGSIMTDMVGTLRGAKVWGDDLVFAVGGVTDAMTTITGALVKVQEGIDSLRSNVSFDLDMAEGGLSLIYTGLGDLADGANLIKDCFAHISDALTKIDSGSDKLDAAMLNFTESIYSVSVAMGILEDMSVGINGLVGYLNGVDPICFPTPSGSITATANQLFVYISAIENELKYLNGDFTGLSSELVESFGKINDIFARLSDNVVNTIYGLNSDTLIDNNVTEEEIDSVTSGKLFGCENNGDVYGDINVGGIGGVMGLEFVLDPEDDLTEDLSVTQKKQYKMKAVIHACINNGQIIAKRNCVGGIVGKMDIGLIYGSCAYGTIQSEAGNYVGGISGITAGLISQCFAKCSLSGGKYIGGIIGSGVSEDYSGDSSMVRNCYTMVEIRNFTQYAGAISGINLGEFSENLFVSSTLSGIDRVSYRGKAERISYEDLIKRRSIPDAFYSFTLDFVADGNILYSTTFEYGTSFDSSVFPEIPAKEGHYGYWDCEELTGLVFDTRVSVVYKPYVTAIGSSETRDDGREIFFVGGEFVEGDSIEIKPGAGTSGLILPDEFFTKDTLVESFTITIPKDNKKTNNIHFLPSTDNCRIFVKINGAWTEVESKQFGSYLTFDVEGDVVEIAVVKHSIKLVPVLGVGGGALLLLILVIVLIAVKRKKARASENKSDEKADEKTDEKVNVSVSKSDEKAGKKSKSNKKGKPGKNH